MVKSILKIFLSSTLIFGLAACQPQIVYKNVYVPVYVVPKSEKIEKPSLVINNLTEEQQKDPGTMIQALKISFVQLKQYSCMVSKVLDKYQELAAKSPLPVEPKIDIKPQQLLQSLPNPTEIKNQNISDLIKQLNESCGINE